MVIYSHVNNNVNREYTQRSSRLASMTARYAGSRPSTILVYWMIIALPFPIELPCDSAHLP